MPVAIEDRVQAVRKQHRVMLLLASVVLGITAFFALDFVYSALTRWKRKPVAQEHPCRVTDPVRHHALKANCSAVDRWGHASYSFFTNNLGFRDERVRQVPQTDARPRLLLLGDSFTEGMIAWRDSYAGMIAARLPQYDFLNGGVSSYAPSNYLNTARMVLARGVDIDEVIVFIDLSDVQDEAAFYRDADKSGAVSGSARESFTTTRYEHWRVHMTQYVLTNYLLECLDRLLVSLGYFDSTLPGDPLDDKRSAWTYRKVDETSSYIDGYAPLGVEGGIAKEKVKMDLLWQELRTRNIPLSVVVYPWPAQIIHDGADSLQVRIWREWCEGKCKRFITLFPAFLAQKQRCSALQPGCWYLKLFIFGDVHYNAAGNTLVADKVIAGLRNDPPKKASVPLSAAGATGTGL